MATPVLWQFKYSHYNEKVRWALDFKGIPHRRESLLPGPHIPVMLWKTTQKQVPVLDLDGELIQDSSRIVDAIEQHWPEPALLPSDEAARASARDLARYFDERLGPQLRLAWFEDLLSEPDYLAAQLCVGFGVIEESLFKAAFPLTRRVMAMDMGINAANAEKAWTVIHAALDRLEAEIGESGYLVGDQFTVADLTAAALWSPFVMPPEFPYPFLRPLPPVAGLHRDQLIRRPGLQWVAEIYRRHRGRSAEVAG